MKILRNIPGIIKAYDALKYLNEYKKEMDSARSSGDLEKEKKNILAATRTWGTKLCEMTGVTFDVSGKENLPAEGPVVYISNHQGYADIVVLCAVLNTVQFGFVAKENLSKVPLYGKWIDRIRSIMIQREDSRESLKSMAKGIRYIENGFSILIFPEGTRSRGPRMGEFKKGAFKMATKPQVPVIPVSIDGTYKIFEERGIITAGHVKVMIHPPVETKGLSRQEEKILPEKIHDTVQNGLDLLRSDSQN